MVRPVIPCLLALLLAGAPLSAQRIKLPMKLPQLEAVASRDSNDAAAHYNLALGYWNEKRFDDAEAQLRQAVQLDARFPEAHLALAFLPYARRPKLLDEEYENRIPKEWEESVVQSDHEYRHAFLISPAVDIRIIGAINRRMNIDFNDLKNYSEVLALFFKGFEDCQQGDYKNGYGRFATLIREIDGDRYPRRIPGSVLWYQGLAAAHIQKFDVAVNNFRLLLDRNIDYEKDHENELTRVPLRTNEYRYFLAYMYHLAGQTDSALVLYQEALDNDIGLYMAHVQIANIYEQQRNYTRAIEARRRAVNANPDDPSLLRDLGVTLGKSGQWIEAVEALKQARAGNPRDYMAPFWLGIAQAQMGKNAEAKATLQQFLDMVPQHERFEKPVAYAREQMAGL